MSRSHAAGSARDLVRAERDIRSRIGEQPLDFAAMAAVSNIYRAAKAVRKPHGAQGADGWGPLVAAFTVMFVPWI